MNVGASREQVAVNEELTDIVGEARLALCCESRTVGRDMPVGLLLVGPTLIFAFRTTNDSYGCAWSGPGGQV